MNLSLLLLVLCAFVGYLLFDMFKKSRQQQELAQSQSRTSNPNQNSRTLRPNYAAQCSILRSLHADKMENLKHKGVSIHLQQNSSPDVSRQVMDKISEIVNQLLKTYRVYLLVSRKAELTSGLARGLLKLGVNEISYQSNEGAVAVLRQLTCTVHIESSLALHKTLIQYLPNVWLLDPKQATDMSANHYNSEEQMLLTLSCLINKKPKQE